jgi:FAD/FMN-containing dehydrogenase
MGGQQCGTDILLINIRKMSRMLNLDRRHGILEIEAGIEWPELIDGYLSFQSRDGELLQSDLCSPLQLTLGGDAGARCN